MSHATADRQRLGRPYSALASIYDSALGLSTFVGTRAAFELLVRRYGISFHSALDVGCGTGLFACYLNHRWGVPVFGIDLSPEKLRIAARRCPHSAVCFLQQDIRSLRLPCQVDLITGNFDTLNHILTGPELKSAFRRIAESLTVGGHFIFDLITSCQSMGAAQTFTRGLGSRKCHAVQQIRWNPLKSLLSISVTIRRPKCQDTIVELHRERAYCPIEVSRWLADTGFIVRGVHDAVTLRVATVCPPRIIVVATKQSC